MSENNKTIADIVAQLRAVAHIQTADTPRSVMQFADRIEAAAKREEAIHAMTCEANERLREHLEIALKNNKRPVGNAAALRKALVAMVKAETDGSMEREDLCGRCLRKLFDECKHDGSCWVDRVMAALSAPPRNCDRYATTDEAIDDFSDDALIEEWNALKAGKDRDMLAKELFMFAKWLFEPAAERKGEEA